MIWKTPALLQRNLGWAVPASLALGFLYGLAFDAKPLGSFLAPLYLKTFVGTSMEISMGRIFSQIALTILLPLVAGALTHRILVSRLGQEGYQTRIHGHLAPFSTLGVLGIVFVAMALKARGIAAHPSELALLIAPLLALYATNFALSIVVGRVFFQRQDAIALVNGSVMRNLSIALAIAMTAFCPIGPEIALIISVACVIQVQAAALSVKLLPRMLP